MLYNTTISFNLELEAENQESVRKKIKSILGHFSGIKNVNINVQRIKQDTKKIVLGEFPIKDVIPYIGMGINKDYQIDDKIYTISMSSQRYFVFRENMSCVCCGLQGTKIYLEYFPTDTQAKPHFNLYGEENGDLVLFTKDHIRAKSKGGKNKHSNYQTMCATCNSLKGCANISLIALREIRKAFDDNKKKISRKQMHLLLTQMKNKFHTPWPSIVKNKKQNMDSVELAVDVNLYYENNMFIARSVYANNSKNSIGCIQEGVYLDVLLEFKDKILCKFGQKEKDVFLLEKGLVRC